VIQLEKSKNPNTVKLVDNFNEYLYIKLTDCGGSVTEAGFMPAGNWSVQGIGVGVQDSRLKVRGSVLPLA
jgi:hypothetical protein